MKRFKSVVIIVEQRFRVKLFCLKKGKTLDYHRFRVDPSLLLDFEELLPKIR